MRLSDYFHNAKLDLPAFHFCRSEDWHKLTCESLNMELIPGLRRIGREFLPRGYPMTTMLKALSVAATLTVATFGTVGSVSAQPAAVRVTVSDLNMSTAEGRARFNARIDRVARQFCDSYRDLRARADCERAIHEEAQADLNRQVELASRNRLNLATRR